MRDPWDVRRQHKAVPVDDRIKRSRRAEAVGVLDGPAGKHSATSAAGHKKIVRVDVALCRHRVHAAVQVVEVVAGIRVVNQIGEFFAIARAASRVGVQHHVAHRCPHLLFKIEAVTVVRERPAVNLQDERIFLRSVEIRRMNDPALDLALVLR